MAPLAVLCTHKKGTIFFEKAVLLKSFFKDIHFEDFVDVGDISLFKNILERYSIKTYIPICRFIPTTPNIDTFQSVIEHILEQQTSIPRQIYNALSYIFGELISNITEHSNCQYGYIFTQFHPIDKMLDICIMDDGRTIYGSYVARNKYLDTIDSEATALQMATMGYSTKNLPQAENRGYGISSSIKMIIEGLKGIMVILSGGALIYCESDKEQIINIPDTCKINGTMLLLRIPTTCTQDFDYKQYII